jgi:hypothetical protein
VRFNGKTHPVHRLIFIYMTGECPQFVDHINGQRSDNRWANLRPATKSQNCANKTRPRNNAAGLRGVTVDNRARTTRYYAHIKVQQKRIYLGSYGTPEEANAAWCEAAKKYFGEFARFE